jgi:hypothetical protein
LDSFRLRNFDKVRKVNFLYENQILLVIVYNEKCKDYLKRFEEVL